MPLVFKYGCQEASLPCAFFKSFACFFFFQFMFGVGCNAFISSYSLGGALCQSHFVPLKPVCFSHGYAHFYQSFTYIFGVYVYVHRSAFFYFRLESPFMIPLSFSKGFGFIKWDNSNVATPGTRRNFYHNFPNCVERMVLVSPLNCFFALHLLNYVRENWKNSIVMIVCSLMLLILSWYGKYHEWPFP